MSDSPLPLDRFPHIVFTAETGTRSASQFDDTGKSGTTGLSQKSGTRNASHKCLMCSEKITGRAKTCSDNCRRASNRRRGQIEHAQSVIISQLKQLQDYADEWPDLWPAIMDAANKAATAASVATRYIAPKGDHYEYPSKAGGQ